MKIENVKLANAVTLNSRSYTFLGREDFVVEVLEKQLVHIVDKRTKRTRATSLYNCIDFDIVGVTGNGSSEARSNGAHARPRSPKPETAN